MKIYIGETSVLGAVSIRRPINDYYDEILAKTPIHFYDNVLQASILADEIIYDSWWKCPKEFRELDFMKQEPLQSPISASQNGKIEREEYEMGISNDMRNISLMNTVDSLREKIVGAFEERVDTEFTNLHQDIYKQLSEKFDDIPREIEIKYFLKSIIGLRGMIDSPLQTISILNNDLITATNRGCHLLLNEYNTQLIHAKYNIVNQFLLQRRFFKVLQRKMIPNFSKLGADDIVKLRDLDSIESFRDWLRSESKRIYNEVPDEKFVKEASEVIDDVAITIEKWAYETKPSRSKLMANVMEFGITNLPLGIGNIITGGLLTLYRILFSGREQKEHYYIYFIIDLRRHARS